MPIPDRHILHSVRKLLPTLGIREETRLQGWHECLLAAGEESWVGRGSDEDAAFWGAVAAAFPTKPARALLLLQAAGAAVEEAPEVAGAEGGAETREGPVEVTAAGEPAGVEAEVEQEQEPEPEPEADAPAEEEPPAGEEAPVVAVVSAPEVEERQEAPGPDPEVALRALIERIEGDIPDLARAAPARQRLVLLGWLAAVRSWQDAESRDLRVAALVPEIVRRLRALTDAWWPGTITAFHRSAWPADCHRDLPQVEAAELVSWEAVEQKSAERMVELEAADAEAGLDADGWADGPLLHPQPPAADEELEALAQAMEKYGSLSHRQPKHLQPPPAETLLRWARLARWLRGATSDDIRWGAVMGRLRFWSPDGGEEVRRTLDPSYRPPQPWSSFLRGSEERANEEAELREVLDARPDGEAGEAQRLSWLLRVLPLTSNHAASVAKAVGPLRGWILSLDAEELPTADRRIRRRLRKLQEALDPQQASETACDEAQDEAAPGLAVGTGLGMGMGSRPVPDEVRRLTRGKPALFVSNRADPELQARLAETFAFHSIDWAEATPRRIDAAVAKINSGSYELVLGATGFLSHKEDWRLSAACKSVGVPYVRVNKGRPGAVALALQRELRGAA